MLRVGILSILIAVAQIYQVNTVELLADYKLWKSVSTQLAYDISGNSRHGRFMNSFIVTDRGISPSTYSLMRFMLYGFLSDDEYSISIWMLNSGSGPYVMCFLPYHGSGYFRIYYRFNTSTTTLQFTNNNEIVISEKTTSITPNIQGWNLHTFRIYINPSYPGRLNINLYLNLVPIHSTFIDSGLASIKIRMLDLDMRDDDTNNLIILNEIWVHKGLSDISDLNYLISGSTSCGCDYKYPTTPSQPCLQAFSQNKTKSGQLCNTSCTNKLESCQSDPTNCIMRSKLGCSYGHYDSESLECVFYCPNASCICPGISSNPALTLLSCSCMGGYIKISDNPPACMLAHCLEYHKVGFKYVCNTTELGYVVDSLGDCCVCASGFTKVQHYPIVCVDTSICIAYTI